MNNQQCRVTQYEAGQHDSMVAPPGCLQWLTGTLGTVQNFNFKVATGTQERETVIMLKNNCSGQQLVPPL